MDGSDFMTETTLLPCPFCGTHDLEINLKGTQPEITCKDCGDAQISIQTSDHFTNEERFYDPDFQFRYEPHYDYGVKGTQRALEVLTERWNTRTCLQPSPVTTDSEVGEAIKYWKQQTAEDMPMLNTLIKSAQDCSHWKSMYEAANTEIDNWEKSYSELKKRMPERIPYAREHALICAALEECHKSYDTREAATSIIEHISKNGLVIVGGEE